MYFDSYRKDIPVSPPSKKTQQQHKQGWKDAILKLSSSQTSHTLIHYCSLSFFKGTVCSLICIWKYSKSLKIIKHTRKYFQNNQDRAEEMLWIHFKCMFWSWSGIQDWDIILSAFALKVFKNLKNRKFLQRKWWSGSDLHNKKIMCTKQQSVQSVSGSWWD